MRWLRHARVPSPIAPGGVLASARGVRARLGGREILHGIDLDVHAGEIIALAGPNGAGKSTLFGALAGDIPATGGDVRIDGEPIAHWSAVELAQRRAVLPQQIVMSFPFRVREVVAMGRAPWANTPFEDADERAIDDAIAAGDVGDLAGRQFLSLSGGERARAAFARVLAQETQWLLLDEPTAALDIHHQEHLLKTVRDRVSAGAGALVVLHDLALAAAHADRIALMRHGHIVALGPPREVLVPDLLSEVYQHAIDVVPNPRTGELLVAPVRL